MGKYNSSTCRVVPLIIEIKGNLEKINKFLSLFGIFVKSLPEEYYYGENEKVLKPPLNHLIELINYIASKQGHYPKTNNPDRKELYSKDAAIKERKRVEAIEELKKIYDSLPSENRKWFIFEGFTHPDIYIEGDDYILIGEGKWTEDHITIQTSNLRTKNKEYRNQMVRHIQGALNLKNNKKIYAFYLVDKDCGYLDDLTKDALKNQLEKETIKISEEEKEKILNCFVGYSTWQDVQKLLPNVGFKTKEEIDKGI